MPLIFSGPGIPRSSLSSVAVIGWDILITILDLAKINSWLEKVERGFLTPLLLFLLK